MSTPRLTLRRITRHSSTLMKFSLDTPTGGYAIRAYSDGEVTIAYPPDRNTMNALDIGGRPERPRLIEEKLHASFIVTPTLLIRDWAPRSFETLTSAHLAQLAELGVEMVLLGTGSRARFPSAAWLAGFSQRGIGLEIMDNGAACRTYSVLVAEGRQIAAALIVG